MGILSVRYPKNNAKTNKPILPAALATAVFFCGMREYKRLKGNKRTYQMLQIDKEREGGEERGSGIPCHCDIV